MRTPARARRGAATRQLRLPACAVLFSSRSTALLSPGGYSAVAVQGEVLRTLARQPNSLAVSAAGSAQLRAGFHSGWCSFARGPGSRWSCLSLYLAWRQSKRSPEESPRRAAAQAVHTSFSCLVPALRALTWCLRARCSLLTRSQSTGCAVLSSTLCLPCLLTYLLFHRRSAHATGRLSRMWSARRAVPEKLLLQRRNAKTD